MPVDLNDIYFLWCLYKIIWTEFDNLDNSNSSLKRWRCASVHALFLGCKGSIWMQSASFSITGSYSCRLFFARNKTCYFLSFWWLYQVWFLHLFLKGFYTLATFFCCHNSKAAMYYFYYSQKFPSNYLHYIRGDIWKGWKILCSIAYFTT